MLCRRVGDVLLLLLLQRRKSATRLRHRPRAAQQGGVQECGVTQTAARTRASAKRAREPAVK